MAKPKHRAPAISIRLTHGDGDTTEIKTVASHPPTPEMIALAERLIEFMTTGETPTALLFERYAKLLRRAEMNPSHVPWHQDVRDFEYAHMDALLPHFKRWQKD